MILKASATKTARTVENPMTARLFLTTVYPTSITGTGVDNGDKSVKEDVVLNEND